MTSTSAHGRQIAVHAALLPVLVSAALLASPRAHAQLSTTIAANGWYQYDSNVFDLPSGAAVPGSCAVSVACDLKHADSYFAYGGAWNLGYQWRRQKLHVTATGTEFEYQHFKRLSHSEYYLDGGWNGAFGQVVTAGFDVKRSHTQLPFYQVIASSQLTVQTEQREAENIGLRFLPKWQFDMLGYQRAINEPLFNQPNLELHEENGAADLKYVSPVGLTAGIAGDYLWGNYTGVIAGFSPLTSTVGTSNLAYRQITGNIIVIYNHKTRSTFNAEFGYSRRTSVSGINTASGVTGHLDYTNQLTGKTSVTLGVSRAIVPYYFNVGSEIDTGANAQVAWQATDKIGVSLAYTYTYAQLPEQGSLPGTNRLDHLQFATLNVSYQASRIFVIRPYAQFQTRASNAPGLNFNRSVYGVQLVVQWQR